MAGGRLGRAALLATALLLGVFAGPGTASAKSDLLTGFSDGLYLSANPAERATWLDRTVDSKAGIVLIGVSWSNVAGSARPVDPSNPASASYDFSRIDGAVRDAGARGLRVLLTIFDTPAWAEGAGRSPRALAGTWKPNPSDLADFAQAVASRYSGGFDPDGSGSAPPLPSVQALEIWNEPNLSGFLMPQYEGTTAVSVALYRQMLNASYAAVKAVSPHISVVAAGAGPYGDPPPYEIGSRVRPVQFWQQLLCVHPVRGKAKKKKKVKYVRTAGCPAPSRFDIFGFHAINTSGGPLRSAINPNDASSADLDRVVRVLRGAERAGTVLPGRHPVWTTEMWFDVVNRTTVPLARWDQQALHLLWKEGASVVINFTIRDSPSDVGDLSPEVGPGRSGIFFADGRPKPAYTAFRFPFVTERIDKRMLLAWGKAPAGGKLVIQRRHRGRWVATRKLKVGQGAVFTAKLPLRGKQRLRAKVAGNQSLVWQQR